jgi:hypothetical protein
MEENKKFYLSFEAMWKAEEKNMGKLSKKKLAELAYGHGKNNGLIMGGAAGLLCGLKASFDRVRK